MTRIILYPYKIGSASVVALQQAIIAKGIRCIRVKPDGVYRPLAIDNIINWGMKVVPNWVAPMLNKPEHVGMASNKLTTLNKLSLAEISIPEYTTEYNVLSQWLENGHTVIARHSLNGHSGEGIQILRGPNDFTRDAPLYTKYKKKRSEYRVHVFNGTVIDVQEKRKQANFERTDDQALVRSHQNGWIFCREDIEFETENHKVRLHGIACMAILALGLQFGAVDIIYNQRDDNYYVLEINTAPGLEGTTLNTYVDAIINSVGQ